MFGFDKLFDYNRDGKLDSWEQAAEFGFMDEMLNKNKRSSALEDAGLDPDDLEMMNPQERRDALEDAGLDADDFDF